MSKARILGHAKLAYGWNPILTGYRGCQPARPMLDSAGELTHRTKRLKRWEHDAVDYYLVQQPCLEREMWNPHMKAIYQFSKPEDTSILRWTPKCDLLPSFVAEFEEAEHAPPQWFFNGYDWEEDHGWEESKTMMALTEKKAAEDTINLRTFCDNPTAESTDERVAYMRRVMVAGYIPSKTMAL